MTDPAAASPAVSGSAAASSASPAASGSAAGSPAASSAVTIAPMQRSHLRAVRHIDRAVYPRPWSKALYLEELRQPHNRVYLVALEPASPAAAGSPATGPATASPADPPAVVGYVGLIAVAGDGHISSLAVDPQMQGHGIGSALLLALHRCVRSQQLPNGHPVGADVKEITALTLEVRASNRVAQSLYSKFGYAPVGTRPGYYRSHPGQDREDALVMWCNDIAADEHGERLQRLAGASL